jgi:hypothetical protein
VRNGADHRQSLASEWDFAFRGLDSGRHPRPSSRLRLFHHDSELAFRWELHDFAPMLLRGIRNIVDDGVFKSRANRRKLSQVVRYLDDFHFHASVSEIMATPANGQCVGRLVQRQFFWIADVMNIHRNVAAERA